MKKIAILFFVVSIATVFAGCDGGGKDLGPLKTGYFLGNANSTVTVEVFSDYECPACSYFEQNSYPGIKANLIDTGKIKYIFHDYPLPQHKDAIPASESSYCAGEQNKYWEMHDILFENQKNLTPAAIKGYGQQIGLQADLFTICLNSHKYRKYIDELIQEGNQKSINATPTIMINGTKVNGGAVSYEELQGIINQLHL